MKIEPIEWKQYIGETINTNLIIRKGQKIQATAFFSQPLIILYQS